MTNKLMQAKKLVKFTGHCPSCKTQVENKGRCPGCGAYFRADGTLLFNSKPLKAPKSTPKPEVKNAPKKENRAQKTTTPTTRKPAEPAPKPEEIQGHENGWFLFD